MSLSDAKLRTGWVENGWHCSLSPGSMLQEAGNAHLSFLFLACSTFRGSSAAGWQFFPKALPLTVLKFLHLPATPGTGAMVSYPKPKISDLEMDTDGVC